MWKQNLAHRYLRSTDQQDRAHQKRQPRASHFHSYRPPPTWVPALSSFPPFSRFLATSIKSFNLSFLCYFNSHNNTRLEQRSDGHISRATGLQSLELLGQHRITFRFKPRKPSSILSRALVTISGSLAGRIC